MKHTTHTSIVLWGFALVWAGIYTGCSCTSEEGDTPLDQDAGLEATEDEDSEQSTVSGNTESTREPVVGALQVTEEQPLPLDSTDREEVETTQTQASDEEEPPTSPEAAESEITEAEGTESEESEESEENLRRQYPLEAVAYQFVTNVRSEPSSRSAVIGYMRRGARVRVTDRVSRRGCQRGWHKVQGGGYVCHAAGVVVAENPDPWPDAPPPPLLDSPLPYRYHSSVRDHIPEYHERPASEQETAVTSYIRAIRAEATAREESENEAGENDESPTNGEAEGDDASEQPAEETSEDEQATESEEPSETATEDTPADEEEQEQVIPAPLRTLLARGFIVSTASIEGRWLRTVRGRYVERTVLTERETSGFSGVELGEDLTLPMAFVTRGRAKALRPRPGNTVRFEVAGTLRRLSALPVLGEVVRRDQRYVSVGKRLLARANVLAVVEPVVRPPHIRENEKWIDINLATQTLVAYEGDQPVFATLVSSGRSADGFGTPTGNFRILTKHVSATMDDPDGGEEAYSIEDVPWTMYFHESYAIHGAFWHNRFGSERSHGCVNLSPSDARWLFFWASPNLPPGWHGVRASRENQGTAVIVREN